MAKIILDNHKLLGTTPDGFQVGSEKVGDNTEEEEGTDPEKVCRLTGKSNPK
ncbi:MAG: hypothetical protein V7703_03585 [Hyphomicrobiales bacterium]